VQPNWAGSSSLKHLLSWGPGWTSEEDSSAAPEISDPQGAAKNEESTPKPSAVPGMHVSLSLSLSLSVYNLNPWAIPTN